MGGWNGENIILNVLGVRYQLNNKKALILIQSFIFR